LVLLYEIVRSASERIVTGFSSDRVGIVVSKLQCRVFGRGLCYSFTDKPLLKYRFCSRWVYRVTPWGLWLLTTHHFSSWN